MVREQDIVVGAGMGLISALFFSTYALENVETYESNLLRGTGSYIQQYEGVKPREALDYAIRTFEITREFQPEQISSLEKEVSGLL